MVETRLHLADETATLACGAALAAVMRPGMVLFLEGGLGAGKTTLTRGLLRALGWGGNVKSPTYTLVEPYELASGPFYHFDLYRLLDPEELELIGGRDYFSSDAICVVEWPDKGAGFLPPADLLIRLTTAGSGRDILVCSGSAAGKTAVDDWQLLIQGQFASER